VLIVRFTLSTGDDYVTGLCTLIVLVDTYLIDSQWPRRKRTRHTHTLYQNTCDYSFCLGPAAFRTLALTCGCSSQHSVAAAISSLR